MLLPQLQANKRIAAEDPRRREAMLYAVIKQIVEKVLSDPQHAMSLDLALGKDLAGIRRVKTGRYRVFFLCTPSMNRTTLLWVGYRRKGDPKDACSEFKRLLLAGRFDPDFEEHGMKRPGT